MKILPLFEVHIQGSLMLVSAAFYLLELFVEGFLIQYCELIPHTSYAPNSIQRFIF